MVRQRRRGRCGTDAGANHQQEQELDALRTRNSKLAAEVVDLKQGFEAIEEIARNDMGMIKDGEIFYQFIDSPAAPAAKTPAPSAPP